MASDHRDEPDDYAILYQVVQAATEAVKHEVYNAQVIRARVAAQHPAIRAEASWLYFAAATALGDARDKLLAKARRLRDAEKDAVEEALGEYESRKHHKRRCQEADDIGALLEIAEADGLDDCWPE